MIGVDENDNKPEPEDATHDKVDDFNEDTCDLCAYDFLKNFWELLAHKHSQNREFINIWKDKLFEDN